MYLCAAQNSCLQTNSEDGLPFFQGYTGNAARPARRIHHQHQAIISSYKLNCCGNITEWGVDLSPAEENITFDLDFQVWRPSPTVRETGCYSLVDSFIVRSISIPVDSESEHVVRITPPPQDQLHFQPGDVLGFYVESEGLFYQDNGVVLLNSGNHTSELVWFASIDVIAQSSQSGSCPYPVGIAGVLNSLTRAAPVISVSTTAYFCSLPTSTIPTPSIVSGSLVAAIAAPLVAVFGIINVVTIVVVTMLYCKIRKLHKTKSTVHEEQIPQNREQVTEEREHIYDYPEV